MVKSSEYKTIKGFNQSSTFANDVSFESQGKIRRTLKVLNSNLGKVAKAAAFLVTPTPMGLAAQAALLGLGWYLSAETEYNSDNQLVYERIYKRHPASYDTVLFSAI
jgi:hypothetical protein